MRRTLRHSIRHEVTLRHQNAVSKYNYSKRHNKFLLPSPAKAICESFCRAEKEIFNVVNYKSCLGEFEKREFSWDCGETIRE